MDPMEEPALFSSKASLQKGSRKIVKKHSFVAESLRTCGEDDNQSFSYLGLSEWLADACSQMGLKRPTPVQRSCIPQILNGLDVLGLAQTGSGKTAAFALPILHRLAQSLYGVFALVLTPTRELAFQLSDQFKALGSGLNLRCSVIIGGLDMIEQAKALMRRPHVVIATPGRLAHLLKNDPDIASVFKRIKFLVLDEADRILDFGFERELGIVLSSLPLHRQTLLFSATMTLELKALHELSGDKAFFFEAYQGLQTVEQLQQQYMFMPLDVKDVYLSYVLSTLQDKDIRSVIIFASTCRTCQLLSLLLDELDIHTTALHSMKSQPQRLASLNRFKSGRVPVLIATDVASRGLDIPTVDLVINYDIPRFTRDYVHRVGRTARAGRGGLSISLVSQYDVDLVHEIETLIGKQLEEYKVDEDDVLKGITKVFKAKRLAAQKMQDSGFEDVLKDRKEKKDTLKDLCLTSELSIWSSVWSTTLRRDAKNMYGDAMRSTRLSIDCKDISLPEDMKEKRGSSGSRQGLDVYNAMDCTFEVVCELWNTMFYVFVSLQI
ncbi:hypothetical protein GOP47_0006589 [Adiantum capillus-veneris]|uniref:RNA helicase n=1 Tax=Adiantum capillus-veneris TaxID=13818 RepID=A0A9D4V460_ADICA|nr:hypothetical protein GOP47_0006589 [Adiantum capillus-veneris]